MPEKALYGRDYIPPAYYEIRLKNLMATYEPVDEVCAGE